MKQPDLAVRLEQIAMDASTLLLTASGSGEVASGGVVLIDLHGRQLAGWSASQVQEIILAAVQKASEATP